MKLVLLGHTPEASRSECDGNHRKAQEVRTSVIPKNGVEGAISDLAHLVRELKSLNQRKISLHNSHYFSLP